MRSSSSAVGPAEADRAALHEVRPLGDRERDVDALLHQDHGGALVGHPLHDRQQLADDDRRKPERQFVDQQHSRLGDERHAQRQHLLLAAAEVARVAMQPLAQQREHLQHFLDGLGATLGVAAARPAGQLQVLLHRQATEHALAARHLADAERGDLVGWRVGDVAAVENDRTAVGFHHTADRLQQRALASAVGAQQRNDLAFLDVEVDAEQHLPAAVARVEIADQQQVGLAAAALVQRLAAGGRGLPHLRDVGVDGVLRRAQNEAADDEQRHQREHAPADADLGC